MRYRWTASPDTYEIVVGPSGLRYSEYTAGNQGAAPTKLVELAPTDIGRIAFEHEIGEPPAALRVLGPILRRPRSSPRTPTAW